MQDWKEFCVDTTFMALEMGEQVEHRARFRIMVPVMERYGLVKAIKWKCESTLEWEPDWDYAYTEFKNLDANHFLFVQN
jgi:hypothetical protein